jgi:hypothetical protein
VRGRTLTGEVVVPPVPVITGEPYDPARSTTVSPPLAFDNAVTTEHGAVEEQLVPTPVAEALRVTAALAGEAAATDSTSEKRRASDSAPTRVVEFIFLFQMLNTGCCDDRRHPR